MEHVLPVMMDSLSCRIHVFQRVKSMIFLEYMEPWLTVIKSQMMEHVKNAQLDIISIFKRIANKSLLLVLDLILTLANVLDVTKDML